MARPRAESGFSSAAGAHNVNGIADAASRPRHREAVQMARYLVTGGAGFIGSHTVDALTARGHEFRLVVLRERPDVAE